TTNLVAKRINASLRVSGIILCMYESSTKLAQEVIDDLQAFLNKNRAERSPWSAARILDTRIRRNIKLAECPSFGKSVLAYALSGNGAYDYQALAQEVLQLNATVVEARAPAGGRGGRRDVKMHETVPSEQPVES